MRGPQGKRAQGPNGALHRFFVGLERVWDRLRPRKAAPEPVIEAYLGYATAEACVLRGRVLSANRFMAPIDTPSRWAAVRNMAGNFFTDELPGVRVAAGTSEAVTDEEGYFHFTIARLPPGTHSIALTSPDHGCRTEATVMVPSPAARLGIISDIDDTVMKTGAHWLPRNLWTTATTLVSNREVFADTAALLETLHGGVNPVFYVSSSPWNLHRYLNTVFEANGVPKGPMFLRDLGVSETQFIKSSHGSHKGDAIDTILAANPTLDFVLIGDTGQHDASIYRDAVVRHGERIRHIVLRQAGRADRMDANALEAIREMNVGLFAGESLQPLLDRTRSLRGPVG
ncbi:MULTISPECIES: phosphatase domain-containing protein [unclassified Roseitalea]|uniref:phosphatase domain-containing protein n=1 Tax=unclassified Roseitalea TaxID=2639107 RepID=UPI0027402282|nr:MULTISPECIES: phosphatase domain-containing protein [unclassified Roseitalea]